MSTASKSADPAEITTEALADLARLAAWVSQGVDMEIGASGQSCRGGLNVTDYGNGRGKEFGRFIIGADRYTGQRRPGGSPVNETAHGAGDSIAEALAVAVERIPAGVEPEARVAA